MNFPALGAYPSQLQGSGTDAQRDGAGFNTAKDVSEIEVQEKWEIFWGPR